jgi:hypothetical protein
VHRRHRARNLELADDVRYGLLLDTMTSSPARSPLRVASTLILLTHPLSFR